MAKFLHLIFLLAALTISAFGSSPSTSQLPASSKSCSDAVMGMVDCVAYIELGSIADAPSTTCCKELKMVVKTGPNCLCEGFKMASDYGIKLDMRRALGLPQACRVTAPYVGNCGLSPIPSPGPVSPVRPPISPISQVVPSPSPSIPSPAPPLSAPVAPPTPSEPSPAPLVSPPPPPAVGTPPVEPPLPYYQSPSPAPSTSGSWHLSSSLLALCVGVAFTSFSYLSV